MFDPVIPLLTTTTLVSDSTQLLVVANLYLLEERCTQHVRSVLNCHPQKGDSTEDTRAVRCGEANASLTTNQRGLIQKFPLPYPFLSIY